ncbi:multidrug resistance protein [Pseudovirgaria hyperparasitica]|uniref:Multidrug resistance protein n=1 Tax=Pseudovirgaria hyperparasitica TaxID=470096 RepID=A0A6A6WDV7_9PEZI|nr:multidrug resistance protein [Pseudovirgaria hyperparasitica]KAF2759747.1 multidrug resistance protein [Pseudovirgaria hyperparasitica]
MVSTEKSSSVARSSSDISEISSDDGAAGFKSYLRVFSYADGFSWFLNVLGTFAAIGSGSVLPLMDLIFGKTVTTFNDFGIGAISPAEFRSRSVDWTLYFIYLFIAKFVLTYVWSLCFNLAALRTTKALRIHFLQQTLRQDIAFFDEEGNGSISIQVTTNGNLINTGISEKVGLIIQGVATFVAAFVIAFVVDATLTGITLAVVPTIVISMVVGVIVETIQEGRILAFYSSAGQVAEEIVASMRTVHAFWAHPALGGRYNSLLDSARKEGMKKSLNIACYYCVEFFCIYAGYGLAFWQGIRRYARGETSQPGSIVTVIFAVILAATAITQVAPQLMHLSKAASAAGALFKVIDRKPSIDALSNSGKRPAKCDGTIDIKGLKFAYPSRPNVHVLQGMDLTLPAGKTTALVGASGSGKSTIIGLIERWYNPIEGSISLDGCRIEELDIEWLRTNIRLVQQEPVLFNVTIFENVCYGLVGTEWYKASEEKQMELVQSACKAAFAHDFIETLPEGYHTHVGERAGRLSGGQKQRIAIARSIISNPTVLLLDEATSALDPKAESVVQDALDNVSAQRTTLIIAHKLSTVRKADNIAVMSAGVIIEQGTHDQLLEIPDGAYARLVKAQDLGKKHDGGLITDDEEIRRGEENMQLLRTKTTEVQVESFSDDPSTPKRSMGYGLLKCIYLIIKQQRSLWLLFFLVLIDGTLGGLAYPALAILFARSITAFTLPPDEMVDQGDFYALMFFIVAIVILLAYFSMGWWTNQISQILTYNYRSQMFHDTIRQDMSFFDKPENTVGAIVSRLSSQPTHVQELLSMNVGIIIVAMVNVVSSSILAIAIAWRLGLVVVFGALPALCFFGYLRIRLEFALDDAITQRFADSAALAAESVSAIRTVASLALERTILDRYRDSLASIEQRSAKFLLWTMFWFSLSQAVNLLAMALGFWYGSRLISFGEYDLQQFYIAFLSVLFSGEAAAQFFSYSTSITKAVTSANYIFWLNAQVPNVREIGPNYGPTDSDTTDECRGASIQAQDIQFAYPERPNIPVLRGVSATARPSQSIAFVGPSGCGKTTMIALLERFYDPASGRFLFNKQDISTLCPRAYRTNIALVQQEPTLYGMSIADNIALGSHGTATEVEIEDACRKANIYDFAASLPDGLRTLCGKSGTQLSGGQRQRIAIARALIRKPKLLLLDEATSALDTESEKIVQDALEKGSEGCTKVAVAHRLSTVKGCDCIFVFAKGKVVERGTHEELIRRRGVYFEMCLGQGLDSA